MRAIIAYVTFARCHSRVHLRFRIARKSLIPLSCRETKFIISRFACQNRRGLHVSPSARCIMWRPSALSIRVRVPSSRDSEILADRKGEGERAREGEKEVYRVAELAQQIGINGDKLSWPVIDEAHRP